MNVFSPADNFFMSEFWLIFKFYVLVTSKVFWNTVYILYFLRKHYFTNHCWSSWKIHFHKTQIILSVQWCIKNAIWLSHNYHSFQGHLKACTLQKITLFQELTSSGYLNTICLKQFIVTCKLLNIYRQRNQYFKEISAVMI